MANANIRHEVFCFTRYNIQRILGSPKLYLILIISYYIKLLYFATCILSTNLGWSNTIFINT